MGSAFLLLAAAALSAPHLPTPQEQSAVKKVVGEWLKDPASAQYKWQKVRSGTSVYCAQVNSKNSYGGYSGYSEFMVFIIGGDATKVLPGASIGEADKPEVVITVSETCRKAGFFSE